MAKNGNNWIIRNEEDLEDPFACYCLMKRFMDIIEEDYVDSNELIVMPVPFIMWLNGRKYISNYAADLLLSVENPLSLEDVLKLVTCSFRIEKKLKRDKGYQVLAEYISCIKGLRKRLYASVNDSADLLENNEFPKNEDGVSLACIIPKEELMIIKSESELNGECNVDDLTYRELYIIVKNLS